MNGDDASENSLENPPTVKVDNELSSEEQSGQEMEQKGLKSPDKTSVHVKEMKRPPKGRQVLPTPSPEQRDIIRAVGEGKCVTIRACAGSGKTTCMLQVAASLPEWRNALIVTYNRSLADECKERIQRLSMGRRTKCYTIHGLASRFAGKVCNDDHKLMRQLDRWDKGLDLSPTHAMPLDLVMIDEAQDLRPLFFKVLSHIFGVAGDSGIQICLVGDPKQMLYDFPTYGDDKATTSFFLHPENYWGKFSKKRTWAHLPLSVSYRLTPNIASFCNLFWGTSMVGGNKASPNVPVDYLVKYPYPSTKHDEDEKLKTSVLAELIDQHGPENVMFLAQSVKRDDLPIRVHINQLMKIKDRRTGLQKYNFHIKENVRGFEGTPDWKNKVRVWTFCGSKGCEADVVVVFGLDIYGRPHALNQIGVALSRARKRLLVIHSKKFVAGRFLKIPYYPVLGDSPGSMDHVLHFGTNNTEEMNLSVPAIESVPSSEQFTKRCELTRQALEKLAASGVIRIHDSSSSSRMMTTSAIGINQAEVKQVYIATEFNYFSASAESRFLEYATWAKCDAGKTIVDSLTEEGEDLIQKDRIEYETNVQFSTTTEDVSALYGEAVVYMLQWECCKFVPNIETIVSNGILRLHPQVEYNENEIRSNLRNMSCEVLTTEDDETLVEEFARKKGKIKGKDLIPFINNRMNIKKKRTSDSSVDGDEVVFPVKAAERNNTDDDSHLAEFLPKIKSIYESETSAKRPYHWIYLANAVMAFSNYHEKFRQIGTDPNSYESWVDSKALECGLERLRDVMKSLSPPSNELKDENASSFEQEVSTSFAEMDFIKEPNNGRTIIGVAGVCDWINKNRAKSTDTEKQESWNDVDLLEIKFVHHLSNIHRLQVLVYTALYALKLNDIKVNMDREDASGFDADDYEWKIEQCRGMLYNARTGEMEICTMQARTAMDFLLDISQFKYNGKDRTKLKEEEKAKMEAFITEKPIKRENPLSSSKGSSLPETCRPFRPKKRLRKNTGKSYYTAVCVDDDDDDVIICSSNEQVDTKSVASTQGDGTDSDPIVLD